MPDAQITFVTALLTYFNYTLLFIFGFLRDARLMLVLRYQNDQKKPQKDYAKLMDGFQDFYIRRLFNRIQDCFNRPINSAPGAWVSVMERKFVDSEKKYMAYCDSDVMALNLSSYNYLGFAESELYMRDLVCESMRRLGVSTCSARTSLGTNDEILKLENFVANFLKKEAAICIGMGFASNSTIIPTIAQKGCLIISDELNHSSIVTGARSSSGTIRVFKHNCVRSLEALLRRSISEGQGKNKKCAWQPWKKIIVVVEGIYSMEGEICDFKNIVRVCKRYKAYVYVDEAHSIGALGSTGRGIMEHCEVDPSDVDLCMGTFTKSFGSVGGYIASSKEVIDYIKRMSISSVEACSMSPPCVRQALLALEMISGKDETSKGREKIDKLKANANFFRAEMQRIGCEVLGDSDSPIVPVMLYNPAKIPFFSRECLSKKIAVVVVGFPATPLIKSRIRFCISAAHNMQDLADAVKIIDDIATRAMIKYKISSNVINIKLIMHYVLPFLLFVFFRF